jgi:colicin import membrane protein
MNLSGYSILSYALAVGIHLVIIALLMTNWEEQEHVQVTPVEKFYIDASVVKQNPHTVKKEKEVRQKKQAQAKILESNKAAQRKAKLTQEALDKQAMLDKQRAEEAEKEKAQIEKSRLEQLLAQQQRDIAENQDKETEQVAEASRVRLEQEVALAVIEEQEYRRAITDDEKAQAYVAQIQREMIQNWSRPPSARNGMQAIVRVRLVPTGEIVSVDVEESSGNDAFDRSVIQAVRKSERFLVPTDSRQFERNFRSFTVLFRPEDLRL